MFFLGNVWRIGAIGVMLTVGWITLLGFEFFKVVETSGLDSIPGGHSPEDADRFAVEQGQNFSRSSWASSARS